MIRRALIWLGLVKPDPRIAIARRALQMLADLSIERGLLHPDAWAYMQSRINEYSVDTPEWWTAMVAAAQTIDLNNERVYAELRRSITTKVMN